MASNKSVSVDKKSSDAKNNSSEDKSDKNDSKNTDFNDNVIEELKGPDRPDENLSGKPDSPNIITNEHVNNAEDRNGGSSKGEASPEMGNVLKESPVSGGGSSKNSAEKPKLPDEVKEEERKNEKDETDDGRTLDEKSMVSEAASHVSNKSSSSKSNSSSSKSSSNRSEFIAYKVDTNCNESELQDIVDSHEKRLKKAFSKVILNPC